MPRLRDDTKYLTLPLLWKSELLLGKYFYDSLNNVFITERLIEEGINLIRFEAIPLFFAHKTT